MAEWIRWNKGLTRKREVVAIAAKLRVDRELVAAKCMLVWEWADDETTDGNLPGITPDFIDEIVSHTGFAQAMQQVGWLKCSSKGLRLPNFERFNGESAKRRSVNTERQRLSRLLRDKSATGVRDKSATTRHDKEDKTERTKKGVDVHRCSWNEETVERSTVKDYARESFVGPEKLGNAPRKGTALRELLLKIAVLRLCGAVSEAFVVDGIEAVRSHSKPVRDRLRFLRAVWSRSPKLPAGVTLSELTDAVELPSDL